MGIWHDGTLMRLCVEGLQIMSGKGSSLGHPATGAGMQLHAADLITPTLSFIAPTVWAIFITINHAALSYRTNESNLLLILSKSVFKSNVRI